MYTILETFVGAGGSHLGFKRAGFKSVFVNDIDKNFLKTLCYNNSELEQTAVISNDDILNLDGRQILAQTNLQVGELDVMFGGIVCKGFSLAGERSPNDKRNYYYRKQLELVGILRPKISIIENVPGIINAEILRHDVSDEIKEEVDKLWKDIENYKGQKAYCRKANTITQDLEENGKILREKKDRLIRELKETNNLISVKDDIELIYNEIGYNLQYKILNSSWYGSATKRDRVIFVAVRNDIDVQYEFPQREYGEKLDKKPRTVFDALALIDYSNEADADNIPMNHAPKTVERFGYIGQGENLAEKIDTLPDELKISKFYSRGSTMRLDGSKPSPTLVPGHSNFPIHPIQHRSITVREAATITGFPIDYKFFGSHTKRCEQVGNAVPPDLAYAVAKQCVELLDEYYKQTNLKGVVTMKKVRVQDDLYLHVNQEWLDKAVIPDDKPRIGGFSDLDEDVEKQLIADFNEMADGKLKCSDANVKKAVELFKLVKNTDKRNAEGIAPVMDRLRKIDSLGNIGDLNAVLKEFVASNVNLPFDMGVEVDMKDSLHHCVMLTGPRAILPDVTYYKPEREQQKVALLGVWQQMVAQLLQFTDLSAENQALYVKDALEFDAIIATLVKSSEEWSDYPAAYNPMTVEEVAKRLAPIDFVKLLKDIFGKLPSKVIVAEPRFLNGFSTLFNEANFDKYKHWAYVTELVGSTSLLSEQLRAIGATYSNILSGVAALPSIEKQAYRLASSVFAEPVGIYYGEKYFGQKAKQDVVDICKEIIETYKLRVSRNDFLSEQTKQKAIKKLNTIVVKMGYPDKCEEIYNKLTFDANGSLFKAVEALRKIRMEDNLGKLYKDVDRSEWPMPGHMVNACYNPTSNDITFPAAILQAPFYSIKQSRSENLGGIGAVIGHEISHAFDNNGAKCDENGNLNNWWTDEDFKRFEERTHAMIEEFDGIELPQGKVNGAFIVSENIADNGGMAVTLEMMSKLKDADYKAYFCNWARVWCMKARPEYLQLLLSVDVHGPAELRANMQPRNFTEWYEAFGVTDKDGMYLAPNKRVTIW